MMNTVLRVTIIRRARAQSQKFPRVASTLWKPATPSNSIEPHVHYPQPYPAAFTLSSGPQFFAPSLCIYLRSCYYTASYIFPSAGTPAIGRPSIISHASSLNSRPPWSYATISLTSLLRAVINPTPPKNKRPTPVPGTPTTYSYKVAPVAVMTLRLRLQENPQLHVRGAGQDGPSR